jgi:hypothetical protein
MVVRGVTLRPRSSVLTVETPFGGFVWNRPVAVIAERDGQISRIPIMDVTLIVTLGLGFGTASFTLLSFIIYYLRQRAKARHH